MSSPTRLQPQVFLLVSFSRGTSDIFLAAKFPLLCSLPRPLGHTGLPASWSCSLTPPAHFRLVGTSGASIVLPDPAQSVAFALLYELQVLHLV